MTREEKIALLQKMDAEQGVSASQAAPVDPSTMSREEKIALLQDMDQKERDKPGLAAQALDYGLRGLDYAGGLSRTALAAPTGVINMEDLKNALQGKAPHSDEILNRLGWDKTKSLSDFAPGMYSETGNEWSKLKKGGMLDPTARGTAGFALDVASDPLTYLSLGASTAAKEGGLAAKGADLALNPVSNVLDAAGTQMYKSAFKKADAKAAQMGKTLMPSDLMLEQGVTGSARGIANQSGDLANQLLARKKELLELADQGGAKADLARAMIPAQDRASYLAALADPNQEGLVSGLKKKIEAYMGRTAAPEQVVKSEVPSAILQESGQPFTREMVQTIPERTSPSLQQLDSWKTSLYNDTGDAAWDTLRRTPEGTKNSKAIARGLKDEIVNAANAIGPQVDRAGNTVDQVGNAIQRANQELGTHLTVAGTLNREALKGEAKNLWTSVDGLTAGAGVLTHAAPQDTLTALLIKKLSDLSKATAFRTTTGYGMTRLADVPGLDAVIRREAINKTQSPAKSSWDRIKPEKEN